MISTIEWMRSAVWWILNPDRLLDMLLDQIEKLSVALAVPPQGAGLSCSEAPTDVPFGEHWPSIAQI